MNAIDELSRQRETDPRAHELLEEFIKHWEPKQETTGDFPGEVPPWRFRPEMRSVIQAFVNESLAPLQKVMTDAMAWQLPRGMVVVDKSTFEELPSTEMELWRGQQRGVWYRVMLKNGYRAELQISYNASLGEDQELWQVDRSL